MTDLYRVDLLRERREEFGLQPPIHVDSSSLLRKGFYLASLPIALSLVLLGFSGIRLWFLSQSADQLKSDHERYEQLSLRIRQHRIAIKKLEASNQELANQLLMLPVSSALLAEVSSITPADLQLLSIQQKERSLRIKGVAIEPMALARIEAFMLLLSKSPLLAGNSIQLIKAAQVKQKSQVQDSPQPDPQGGNAGLIPQGKISLGGGQRIPGIPSNAGSVRTVGPTSTQLLGFELTASLTKESLKDLVADLIQLGAKGVLVRARELENLGILK